MNKSPSFTALVTAALIGIAADSAWSDEAAPNVSAAPAVQTPAPATGPVPGWYPPPPNRGRYAQPWQQPSQWSAPQRGYRQFPPYYPPRGQYRAAPAAPAAAPNPLSAELKQTQEQLTAKSTELDETHATLEQLQGKLQHSLEAEHALREKMADITREQQDLQARVTELTAELNTTTATLEQHRQQITNDQQENLTLTSERDRLRSDLAISDEQLSTLQTELQAATQVLQQTQSDTTTSSQQLSEARAQAETLTAELTELKAQLESQQSSLLEAEQTQTAERDSLRNELASRDAQLATVQAELQAATQALQQTQSETTASSQQLSDARAQAETLTAELTELKAQLENQQSSLLEAEQTQTAERDSLRNELASRDAQLATVQAELQAATQALQQTQSETTASSQQLSDARAQAETLTTELTELKAQLESQQNTLLDTEQTLAAVIAKRDGLQTDIAACSRELTLAQDALTAARSEMDAIGRAPSTAAGVVVAPAPDRSDKVEPAASEALEASADEVAALQISDTDKDGTPDSSDLCPGTQHGIAVESTGCAAGEAISLAGVNFLSSSHELTDKARSILDRVAAILTQQPDLRLEVAGHTDAQGDPTYNQWLSLQRAEAVMDYLVAQGVNPKHIGAAGYGGQRPIADNTTSEGLQMNRRVELRRLQ